MFEWLKANYGLILAILSGAIIFLSVVNRASDHWSSLEGEWYRRMIPVAIFFLTELLSVWTSKNSPGKWKLPLTSVPPRNKAILP